MLTSADCGYDAAQEDREVLRSTEPFLPTAYTCTIDSLARVDGIDWLKVQASWTNPNSTVGWIPDGSTFHFCKVSRQVTGDKWVSGYGYNGTTKLNGWVPIRFLSGL